MSQQDTHNQVIFNIAGGWLGTYAYQPGSRLPPMRFEATFAADPEQAGGFRGTILDDGPLGEATVTGSQSGRQVRFTKIYRATKACYRTGPVEYEGTISDDGLNIAGTWRLTTNLLGLPLRTQGVWDARRRWHAEEEPEAVADSESNKHIMREV